MSRKTIYRGRLIDLGIDHCTLPDGRELELEVVHHPGGAVIVAVNNGGDVCLLRQYRHAGGGEIWELPAGCIDPDDSSPIETARRELQEEAGITAQDWTPLGSVLTSPGFCDERLYLFLARDLAPAQSAPQSDEFITVHWLPMDDALRMALSGEIVDAKTVVALFRAQTTLVF